MVLSVTDKNSNTTSRLSQPLKVFSQGVFPYLEEGQANPALTSETSYCGQYAKLGNCENYHHWVKVIYCGREWCKHCREVTHNRRMARWLPKAYVMDSHGIFVFTIPLEMRLFFQEKEHLTEIRTYLRKRLRQMYPDIKALTRWHFFGENCYLYHPHLNVMVSSFEKLSKKEIEVIREDYQSALERITHIKLDKKVNMHYHYYSREGFKKKYLKKGQKISDEYAQKLYYKALWDNLKYITRPTFVVYQRELAEKLKNFRNNSTWGKFRELCYEEIERMDIRKESSLKVDANLVKLQTGCCPKCGKTINWEREIRHSDEFLCLYECEAVGSGYYSLGEKKVRGSPKLPGKKALEEARHYRLLLYEQAMNENKWKERVDIYG